jgi:hypothetical protein
MEYIDGELCILNEEGEVTYVFEREHLSRAAYKHMSEWVRLNFDSKLTYEENWSKADAAWEALTPEHKMLLWSMSQQESQNASDICTGLLATLESYQGLRVVKNMFKDAITSVKNVFNS